MIARSKTFAAVALAVVATACGSTDVNTDSMAKTSTEPFVFPTETTLSADAQQFRSPQEICAALTPQDMAPLTNGEVTDEPAPTYNGGLPGCEWPVQDGYGWLQLSVFKQVSIDALIANSEEQFQVGNSTAYQTFPDTGYTCRGIVVSSDAPKGYVLNFALDKALGTGTVNPDLCELAIPQTTKVLERLGW